MAAGRTAHITGEGPGLGGPSHSSRSTRRRQPRPDGFNSDHSTGRRHDHTQQNTYTGDRGTASGVPPSADTHTKAQYRHGHRGPVRPQTPRPNTYTDTEAQYRHGHRGPVQTQTPRPSRDTTEAHYRHRHRGPLQAQTPRPSTDTDNEARYKHDRGLVQTRTPRPSTNMTEAHYKRDRSPVQVQATKPSIKEGCFRGHID